MLLGSSYFLRTSYISLEEFSVGPVSLNRKTEHLKCSYLLLQHPKLYVLCLVLTVISIRLLLLSKKGSCLPFKFCIHWMTTESTSKLSLNFLFNFSIFSVIHREFCKSKQKKGRIFQGVHVETSTALTSLHLWPFTKRI